MNLPPFPDSYIPTSPEVRLRLLQWGEECARMGAEAAEPMTALRVSDTHEWRLVRWEWRVGDPEAWELHYLPGGHTTYIRSADQFEAQMLDAAKRAIDAARNAQHSTDGGRE